jgi:hypothetical protein
MQVMIEKIHGWGVFHGSKVTKMSVGFRTFSQSISLVKRQRRFERSGWHEA